MRLDARHEVLVEAIAGLGNVVRDGEADAELVGDADLGEGVLEHEAGGAEHGEAAVLELLELLLLVLLRGVVEAERVPVGLLAEAEVAGAGGALEELVNVELLDEADGEEHLDPAGERDVLHGIERVSVGEHISAELLVAREVGKGREEVANDGEHGHAAVGDFGLAVPGEVRDGLAAHKEGLLLELGVAKRVEADVTDEGAIEALRAVHPRQSHGAVLVRAGHGELRGRRRRATS
mmetsp:Transcript_45346/g.142176  ORF Transcript_45346/g.142176 Transcript_45346/m.142176 type:complete len:236 (-) Transcript_45346:356-1063(-)